MDTQPSRVERDRRPALRATVVAVVLGAVILVVGMLEEPYHIDELRQVESYPKPVGTLIDLSFGQEQPPLDPLLGKVVRRVFGEGHVEQRLHPTVLGMGSLVLLALLLWGRGVRLGVPVAVLLYGMVPVVVGVTAYARQYALPIFLWLAFLVGADRWLRRRSVPGVAVAVGTALLLPLSRSVEPLIFLGAVLGTLAVWHLRGCSWRAPSWPLAAATMGSLLAVGVPVLLRFRSEASEFIAPPEGLGDRVGRLITDLPSALAESAAVWPIALAGILVAAATPAVRRFVREEWWIWPLVAIPFGFAAAFFVLANADQRFFLRYTYSWWLPVAILIGVGAEWGIDRLRSNGPELLPVAVSVLTALVLLSTGVDLVHDLSRDDWVDYEPLARLIDAEVPADQVVYFDNLVPLGAYRAGFAGRNRFLEDGPDIAAAPAILRNPTVAEADEGFVVALSGPEVVVSGWVAERASRAMYLYVPTEPVAGPAEAGWTLVAFGRAVQLEDGLMLRLAGAALLGASGDLDAACAEVVAARRDAPGSVENIGEALRGTPLADQIEVCLASS